MVATIGGGGNQSIADNEAYNGTISVEVYEPGSDEPLASAEHEGKVTGNRYSYKYDGIVDHSLQADMDDVTIGIFKGDRRNVKDLLGESAILHITCSASTVNSGSVVGGTDENILLTGDARNDYFITGVKAGTSTDKNGDAKVELSIKKGNCKFHSNTSATATTTVYVFKKPTTATTAHTLTLTGNIDERCTYYINGNKGKETKDENGNTTILFTGLNPNTSYQVEVRGHYKDEKDIDRIAYAYVYDTTKPIYTGSVEVYLDGTYDSANHTVTSGKKVNLETVAGDSNKEIYVKDINSDEFIQLTKTADENGINTYSSVLDEGSYHLYYQPDADSQIDQQFLIMHNADRVRYLFYNSVTYYSDDKGNDVFDTKYYVTDSSVNVIKDVPKRDGFVFTGWMDEKGTLYTPDKLLTSNISTPIKLYACWEEGVDVYINFDINHMDGNNGHNANVNDKDRHNIVFDLMTRPNNSLGDYVDVFDKPMEIIWDGTSEFNSMTGTESGNILVNEFFSADHQEDTTSDHTYYTYKLDAPILPDVLTDSQYTVEVIKPGYEIEEIDVTRDDKQNFIINVKIGYEPKNGDLKFKVKIAEESEELIRKNPDYMPSAVHVKVLSYYTNEYNVHGHTLTAKEWHHITQHHDTYVTLYLKDNGTDIFAEGSYPVWMHNNLKTEYYHYRIKIVSYVLPDGTVVDVNDLPDANGQKNIQYISTHERYTATIYVTGGKKPDPVNSDLEGAHFHTSDNSQQGDIVAEIKVNTHKVTFYPNDGKFSDGETDPKTVTEQLVVPDLSKYTPTRDDGYVFDGWHTKNENNELVQATVNSGDELLKDIELFAAWKAPRTVKGQIFVAGYYYLDKEGNEFAQILENDRTHAVTVYLQKLLANDYAETVDTQQIQISYNDANDESIEKPFGYGEYSFTKVPDDGHRYRIFIQNPNYIVSYQNEPDSINSELVNKFINAYHTDKGFEAVFDYYPYNVAVVNSFMRFDPIDFDLKYKVDASRIAEGFRPSETEIVVRCDDGKNGPNPHEWTVITQMDKGEAGFEGQTNGFDQNGFSLNKENESNILSYPVWRTKTDGHNLYDYSVSLDSYKLGSEVAAFNASSAPFFVYYNGSARYSAINNDNQTQLLTVELAPKTYTITFKPNFEESETDYMQNFPYYVGEGVYKTGHVWSYETIINDVPKRTGYKFLGWTDEDGNIVQTINVKPSVAEDLVFTAIWEKFEVTFHTNNENIKVDDIFRVYYENGNAPEGAEYTLDEYGKIKSFYDLPELSNEDNNKYIFKGWYLDPVDEDHPIDWNAQYDSSTDIYAHWIEVGTVAKNPSDEKELPYENKDQYPGFDLVGIQIREEKVDNGNHYGKEGSGLRFITVLGTELYEKINQITDYNNNRPNESGAEYGFILASTDRIQNAANGKPDYRLLLNRENVNGVDNSVLYNYAQSVNCQKYQNHREYDDYILYTAVITYDGYDGDALDKAHDTCITARPYISYADANGLLRTYYNYYTGTYAYGGCSASYSMASSEDSVQK